MKLNNICVNTKSGLDIYKRKATLHVGLNEIFEDPEKQTVWYLGYREDAFNFAIDAILHETLHLVLHRLFKGNKEYYGFSDCAFHHCCDECRYEFGCHLKLFWFIKLRGVV